MSRNNWTDDVYFKLNISLPHAPIFSQWLHTYDHEVSSYNNQEKTLTLSCEVSSKIMTAPVSAKKQSLPDRLNNRIAAPGISLLHACAKHTFLSLAVEGL